MSYIIVIVLVSFSGLFSGLTLGLLGLDNHDLKRKISLGNKDAKKVYSVRKRGNLLLCTLLLGNVGVNTALAIFLGDIASGVTAGVIATGLILIFGEIIPQATFARFALKIGARTAWLVKIMIVIGYPICGPIAWILNKIFGEEMPTIYSKRELMKIVEEHEGSKQSSIDADEKRIIKGALSYSSKKVEKVMTPRTVLYALDLNRALDNDLLEEIKKEGFTRIPVYKGSIDNMVGVLYAKDLINIKIGKKVSSIYTKKNILRVKESLDLDKMFSLFIKSRVFLAFAEDEYGTLQGVVTLEDVVEEILKVEIVDETDKVADLQKVAKNKLKK